MNRFLLAVTLTLVCPSAGPQKLAALQQSPFPAPTGPYAVGRTHFDWIDSSRVDLENRRGHRELVVWVWYPASPRSDAKQAAWLPGVWGDMDRGWQDRLARLTARPGSTVRERTTAADTTLVHSFTDAPIALGQHKYPVLVFAAGWGVLPLKYSNVIEELASHGYVVAGVVFTYYSPYAVFSDGDVAGQHEFALDLPGAPPRYYRGPVPPPVIRIKTDDLRFTLNQLAIVNADVNSPFRGRFDVDRVGFLGHSSGAAVALQAAKEDSRVRAVASFDGNLANFNDDPTMPKPLLWVSAGVGASGPVTPDNRGELLTRVLRSAPAAYNVIIAGTTHFFSGDDGLRAGSQPAGRADPVRALKVTKDYTRAFFDEQLRGITSSLLAGPSTDYPDATLDIVERTRGRQCGLSVVPAYNRNAQLGPHSLALIGRPERVAGALDSADLRTALERHHADCVTWALVCCRFERAEASDVLQDAYLKVLDGRAVYRGGFPFRAWLFGVVRRTASEHRRRIYRRLISRCRAENNQLPADPPDPDALFDHRVAAERLRRALMVLPARQRQVLHLVFDENLTLEEAAAIMAVSIGSARTHYARGKARLRMLLQGEQRR